jgi:hypothetical protein
MCSSQISSVGQMSYADMVWQCPKQVARASLLLSTRSSLNELVKIASCEKSGVLILVIVLMKSIVLVTVHLFVSIVCIMYYQ